MPQSSQHKTLPARPDLDWLRKAAKERLAEMRRTDGDAELHQAQLGVAREYGFASWRALKAHVDALSLDGQIIAATVAGDANALARLLDEHPAKITIIDDRWNRPLLHLAAERGHRACVEVLLACGFNVDRRDRPDHATALHWAAYAGRLDVAKRLIAAGADVDADDDLHELGVLGWATCFQDVHSDVAELLLAEGAKPSIFAATALGRLDELRTLIERDRSLLARQMSKFEHYRTPLHLAVIKNEPRVVDLLLQLGADMRIKDSRGLTPLDCADAATDPEVVDRLVAAGATRRKERGNFFGGAVPILNVANVPDSIAYYVDSLGFELDWVWGTPPGFACVFRDNVRIFLCQDGQGAKGTWISIFVDDVDRLYQRYEECGAIVRQPPTNFPWGVREMNVEDIDGHRLRIGSDVTGPADGVPLAEAP
jgi:ankyrin repeat protein/uncharacterized glyoxalase superfamily protein PhnB